MLHRARARSRRPKRRSKASPSAAGPRRFWPFCDSTTGGQSPHLPGEDCAKGGEKNKKLYLKPGMLLKTKGRIFGNLECLTK